MKKLSFFFFSSIVAYCTLVPQAIANSGCLQLNNGGTTTRQFCPTPTPQAAFPSDSMTQTAPGRQKVYPASQAKATPNTGPEAISLIGLLPLAGAGFFLKKKAK